MNSRFVRLVLLSASFMSLTTPAAHAASFYLQEQSVSGMGEAFAGAAADTQNASTVYYNPAGMVELADPEIYAGATLLLPSADYDDRGSTITGAGYGGTVALSGTDSGNPFDPAVVPQLFGVLPVNDRIAVGLGITAPFGLADQYDETWIARYNSTDSELRTVSIQPSVAYKVNEWMSIGGGVNIQYVYANLKNSIPSPLAASPAEGNQRLSGHDWDYGFNLGLQFKPTDMTKVGLTYKTGISHDIDGTINVKYPPVAGLADATVPGTAELDLPNIASLGVSQQLNDKWTVLGSVNWYEWSNFNDIPVASSLGFTQKFQNYENTWGFAIGARYRMNERWLFRGGFQYDQTPTVTPDRSTRIPDGDRMWFMGGVTYSLTPKVDLDFSAGYVDVSEENIDTTDVFPSAATTTVNTRGRTDGGVGLMAAAIRYKF